MTYQDSFKKALQWMSSHRWLVLAYAAVLLGAIAVRLKIALLAPERLLPTMLDDSFFYFRVAEKIATGAGSTLDGVHLTNGYHPLWTGVLVVVYRFFPHFHGSFFTAAALVQVAFNLLSAVFLWKTIRTLTSRLWIQWFGVSLYLLNPHVIYYSVNGMETSLYLLMVSIVLFQFFHWALVKPPKHYVWIGVMGALLFLTRTDSVFVLAPIFLAMVWRESTERRRSAFLSLVLPSVLLSAPWFLWSYATFHSWVQINAYAPPLGKRLIIGAPHAPYHLRDLFWMAKYGGWELMNNIVSFSSLVAMRVAMLISVGMGMVVAALSGKAARDDGWFRKVLGWYALPVASFSFIFFANSFIRWYNRDYYVIVWNLLAVLFVVMVWEGLRRLEIKGVRLMMGVFLFFAACGYINVYREVYRPSVARSIGSNMSVMAAATWMNSHIPAGSRIGSFKCAGILTYWSTNPVTNLDGKINNSVFPYLMQKDVWTYLKENNIQYIVEPTNKLQTRGAFFNGMPFEGKITKIHEENEATLGYPVVGVDIFQVNL